VARGYLFVKSVLDSTDRTLVIVTPPVTSA